MPEAIVVSSSRAEEVLNRIFQIKQDMIGSMLDLGDLLAEAKQEDYPRTWGYPNFDEWLENSGLEVGRSTAYYLIKIVNKSRELGIPREQLSKSKISHLKEIFSLPLERGEEIKKLVEGAPEMSLEDVKASVSGIRGEEGLEKLTWRNFRVTESQANVIDQAVEKAKMESPQTLTEEGEIVDISDGTALEMICADFNSNPDALRAEIEGME